MTEPEIISDTSYSLPAEENPHDESGASDYTPITVFMTHAGLVIRNDNGGMMIGQLQAVHLYKVLREIVTGEPIDNEAVPYDEPGIENPEEDQEGDTAPLPTRRRVQDHQSERGRSPRPIRGRRR